MLVFSFASFGLILVALHWRWILFYFYFFFAWLGLFQDVVSGVFVICAPGCFSGLLFGRSGSDFLGFGALSFFQVFLF